MRAWVALVTLALALGAAHAQDMGRILVPHKGLNQLPAGGPKFSIPFDGKWYEPPALPANHYRGAYEHVTCAADMLVSPDNTAELAAAIKDARARAQQQGRPLKMRPARRGFATMASFACAHQPTLTTPFRVKGQEPFVVGLMLEKMNKVLAVNKEAKQLKVQAQMTLKNLYDAADAAGLSTPRSALPWWQGLTLGGVFSTASHGTGNNATHMICDWFVDVTWVDARGAVHVSPKGSEEAKALCGGLGLLGTITELTLQLTEHSNTHFFTRYLKDDTNIADDVEEMLKITPHIVVMWRPDIGKYTAHLQEPAQPGAKIIDKAQANVIPQMNDMLAGIGGPMLRAWQSDPWNKQGIYYAMGFDSAVCSVAHNNAVGASWVTVPGPFGKAGYTALPIFEGTAPTNHITSTECGDNCAFTSKKMMATALDVMLAFERSRLKEWVADIKQLIAKDLRSVPGWGAHTRCLLPGYYVMRFGRPNTETYLGYAAGLSQPVYVQQQMLASKATPGIPSRYEWVQEVFEQLTSCKYGGRLHTGKNWDRSFLGLRCPTPAKYGDNWSKMLAMQDKYDPERVYEPELFSRMVAGAGYAHKPRCQLDRSCYCTADEHCADGFECVPSIAFPEYTSCRPKNMN